MRELVDKKLMLEDVKSWVAMDSYDQHWINNMSAWIENLPTVEVSDEDCISRRMAIDAAMQDVSCTRTNQFNAGATRAANRIKKLPSIQPERKKSVWIRMSDRDGEYYCCNNCGEELPRYMSEMPSWDMPYPHKYSIDPTDFCPHCGADMKGEESEDA